MKKRFYKNLINESKEDEEKFINKFGEERFQLFKKQHNNIIKQYDNNHGDMTWVVSHLSAMNLDTLLAATKSLKDQEQSELDKIVNSEEAKQAKKIYDKDGFEIYKIMSVAASVKYGLVVGGRSNWCTSGGYGDVRDGSIYNAASKFYHQYLQDKYRGYYICFAPDGKKYNICPLKNPTPFGKIADVWEGKTDAKVKLIPNLNDDIIDPDDGSIIYTPVLKEFSDAQKQEILQEFANEIGIDVSQVENYTINVDNDIEANIDDGAKYSIVTEDRADQLLIDEYNDDYLDEIVSQLFSDASSINELPWWLEDNLNAHGLDNDMKEDLENIYSDDEEVIYELTNSYVGEVIEGIEITEDLSEDDLTTKQINKLRDFIVDDKMSLYYSGLDYFIENDYSLTDLPGEYSKFVNFVELRNTLIQEDSYAALSKYDEKWYQFSACNTWWIAYRIDY